MTETKYIFPKQPQSMAVLAFIAVLIILLLVLIVMVHMRNRKLKSILEEQMAERQLLDKISADFMAVYMYERFMLGYEPQFSKSTPGACFGVVGEEFNAYACNITFGSNKNEIQQRCLTAMVFYGQDTGCKLQENHDELGVLLPLKEFEHNILHHLEQVDGVVLRCREEMIHQAGKDSLPL